MSSTSFLCSRRSTVTSKRQMFRRGLICTFCVEKVVDDLNWFWSLLWIIRKTIFFVVNLKKRSNNLMLIIWAGWLLSWLWPLKLVFYKGRWYFKGNLFTLLRLIPWDLWVNETIILDKQIIFNMATLVHRYGKLYYKSKPCRYENATSN